MKKPVTAIGQDSIRRHFDKSQNKWYYSVSDVLGALAGSTDARNYWKVLKSRLKKKDFDLVSKCNRLKLKSRDGKNYLTDTADAETLIRIIESVPRASTEAFKILVKEIEGKIEYIDESKKIESKKWPADKKDALEDYDAKLLVDAYETENEIFIHAMLAGVDPEDLSVKVAKRKIIISGKRKKEIIPVSGDCLKEELEWLSFYRSIDLPKPVRIESIKREENFGSLTIELTKI